MTRSAASGRWSPSLPVAAGAAVVLGAIGLLTSRPDIVAMGLPAVLWCVLALAGRPAGPRARATLIAQPIEDAQVRTTIEVATDAEVAEMVVVQSQRRTRRVVVPGSGASIVAASRILHSGPAVPVQVAARGFAFDGAVIAASSAAVAGRRSVAPATRAVGAVPVPRRLNGLHGGHEGRRQGQGGDFRDIHAFAPGDELRRVDWRATARMARRPGDLLVRRTDTLSDASIVIALDAAEDLGEVVASWGGGDDERSGVTSLDHARQAARSLAVAAIAAGDRVALHALVNEGQSLRSGGGTRHLARIEAAIAATGQATGDATYRRAPTVPHGSVIFVLSTFLQGAAARTALMWRATGHRVIAIDVLPALDRSRLTRPQLIGLRTVLAERENVFADLQGAGVEVVVWADEPALRLHEMTRAR